jgi:hypothetical protein
MQLHVNPSICFNSKTVKDAHMHVDFADNVRAQRYLQPSLGACAYATAFK